MYNVMHQAEDDLYTERRININATRRLKREMQLRKDEEQARVDEEVER